MSELASAKDIETNAKKPLDPGRSGLEDVIAADSSICFIDGQRSRLIYRGYSIDDLANHATFDEIVHLLLFKKFPDRSQLAKFSASLAGQRNLDPKFVDRMNTIPKNANTMTVLRTLVSALSFFDLEAEAVDYDSVLKKSIRLIAQLPAIIASWHRISKGEKPIEPKKNLPHASNFLYMLFGKDPDPDFSQALDLYLVLLADHELNASTFAARVTA